MWRPRSQKSFKITGNSFSNSNAFVLPLGDSTYSPPHPKPLSTSKESLPSLAAREDNPKENQNEIYDEREELRLNDASDYRLGDGSDPDYPQPFFLRVDGGFGRHIDGLPVVADFYFYLGSQIIFSYGFRCHSDTSHNGSDVTQIRHNVVP
eukprot:1354846-Amorphochlora_amoeboformis.AAC.2